jgi:hypothetical protein
MGAGGALGATRSIFGGPNEAPELCAGFQEHRSFGVDPPGSGDYWCGARCVWWSGDCPMGFGSFGRRYWGCFRCRAVRAAGVAQESQ